MYIVSACLIGIKCKYNGEDNKNEAVIDFLKNKKYTAICPEMQGGLKSPRVPSEIRDGRVISINGEDLTEIFHKGAELSWKKVLKAAETEKESIEGAILMSRSPSCGSGAIYDGTFSGKLIEGDGIMAEFLKERGIRITTPEKILKKF